MYVCKNKFSILHFLIIPVVNLVMCLPVIIMGKPILDILKVYFEQTTLSDSLVSNYPNIYMMLNNVQAFKYAGFIVTVVILALLLFYFIYKKVKWNTDKIMTLALLILVIVIYTLPGMHDRYLYVGEVLSIVYYLAYKKNLPLVIMVNLNALIIYSIYLAKFPNNILAPLSIVYGIVIIYFVGNALKDICDSKEVVNE